MSPRYVRAGGVAVDLGGGAAGEGRYPQSLLDDGVNTAASIRAVTTVVASATPHTEGTAVDIVTNLSADADGLYLTVSSATSVSTANSSTLIEIGVDPAGGTTYAWDLSVAVGYVASARSVFVPGRFAAGSRVALRCRSAIVSQSVNVIPQFIAKTGSGLGAAVTYQASPTTSRGLTITAPGSLNTKGAWTELSASVGVDLACLLVGVQGAGGTVMNGSGVLIDIGFDPAGGSTYGIAIPDIYLAGSASEAYASHSPLTYDVSIPAGSSLAARYARAHAGNAVDLVVVGAPLA